MFILVPTISIGQRCYYEKDEIDKNTNLVIRRTAPINLCKVNGHPFSFKSQQIGDRKYLKLRYFRYNNFSIIEGSKFIFYFQNGDNLMIEPLEIKKKPKTEQSGFSTTSSLIIYQLSKDVFNILLDNLVVEVGFYSNTGIMKQEIKAKNQDVIQQLLVCIL